MSAEQKRNHPEDAGQISTRPEPSGPRKWLAIIAATGVMAAVSLAVALLLPVGLASGQDAGTPATPTPDPETEAHDDHADSEEGPEHEADCEENHRTEDSDHADCGTSHAAEGPEHEAHANSAAGPEHDADCAENHSTESSDHASCGISHADHADHEDDNHVDDHPFNHDDHTH
ncbi:hypothetical protein [Candidatus Poriferisocius sp.]|uniref:hypothetical protein n=1 Tax=Candidatus Poriferisocius sp. TaxID=3101276 RepID=UPI003B02DBD4